MKSEILVVTGTTCVGKSDFATELAKKRGAEVLCMDAFQIYQKMPILSAAPTLSQRAECPHHLFEFVDPLNNFSIKEYYDKVTDAIKDCWERGVTPLLVGGTGLYLRVLRHGLESSKAEQNPEFREEMESLAQQSGREAVHKLLEEKNSKRSSELHPNDLKRVIRALEIENFSKQGKQTRDELAPFCAHWEIYCLQAGREALYNKMNQRVLQMIDDGVEEEVRNLLALGVCEGMTSYQAIGLKETAQYLRGEIDRERWIEIFMRNTRRFAKRQGTWWRSMQDIQIINREL